MYAIAMIPNDLVEAQDRVTVVVALSRRKNAGRRRALLVHGNELQAPARLLVSYGIRGDTPVMRRLRERLPDCGVLSQDYGRTACFLVDDEAMRDLEQEFPGPMGYVMDAPE